LVTSHQPLPALGASTAAAAPFGCCNQAVTLKCRAQGPMMSVIEIFQQLRAEIGGAQAGIILSSGSRLSCPREWKKWAGGTGAVFRQRPRPAKFSFWISLPDLTSPSKQTIYTLSPIVSAIATYQHLTLS